MTNSPFYRRMLSPSLDPDSISLDDLQTLPTTSKKDFSEHNADFLSVPRQKLADIVLTSGTCGDANQVAYTQADLDRLAQCEFLAMSAAGVTPDDVAMLTCTMDRCFVAGLAYYLGLRRIGAAVIRTGQMPLASLMDLVGRMQPTVLVGVPGFLRKLALTMKEHGCSPAASGVKRLVLIGDALRDARWEPLPVARDLESLWNAAVYSTYASTETVTAFCECDQRRGGHLLPEFALLEILDEHDRPVPAGNTGEVVLTPLGIEAMPLLRYKTGDISFVNPAPCACGRTAPRLGPILGRKAQMIKYKGTTLFPSAVLCTVDLFPEIEEACLDIGLDENGHDGLTLHICLRKGAGHQTELVGKLSAALQGRIRVLPEIVVGSPEEVRAIVYPAQSRKAVRCRDRRHEHS